VVAAAGRLKLFPATWARTLHFRRFAVVGVVKTLLDYVLSVGLTKILQLPLDLVWIAKVVSGTVVYRLSQTTGGLFRYLLLVHRREGGEQPERVLVTDPWLLATVPM
jgi:hypothetical protein